LISIFLSSFPYKGKKTEAFQKNEKIFTAGGTTDDTDVTDAFLTEGR
jgi:hypothetical protein